ncbi:MAG: FxDxF family PEP-CTERM protein [Pseudomonadota bacterium]
MMKKVLFNNLAGSLLLSAGVLASSAASAEVLTFDAAGNATFGAVHAAPGSYLDEYLFKVSPENLAWPSGSAVVGKALVGASRLANYGISNVAFFRLNADSSRTTLAGDFSGGGTVEFFPDDVLSSGRYGFLVTGNTTLDGTGGSYAGSLNLLTTPVPEPATYGMLVAGLGVLALTARRKRKGKQD